MPKLSTDLSRSQLIGMIAKLRGDLHDAVMELADYCVPEEGQARRELMEQLDRALKITRFDLSGDDAEHDGFDMSWMEE